MSPGLTTSNASDLVIGVFGNYSGTAPTAWSSPSSPWNTSGSLQYTATAGEAHGLFWQAVSSTGTFAPTFTPGGGSSWEEGTGIVIAFQGAAALTVDDSDWPMLSAYQAGFSTV